MFQLSGRLRWMDTLASERCQQQAMHQQGLWDGELETLWPLKSVLEALCLPSSGWSEVWLLLPWWWPFAWYGAPGRRKRKTRKRLRDPSRQMKTLSRLAPVMKCNLWSGLVSEHLRMALLRHLLQASAQECLAEFAHVCWYLFIKIYQVFYLCGFAEARLVA